MHQLHSLILISEQMKLRWQSQNLILIILQALRHLFLNYFTYIVINGIRGEAKENQLHFQKAHTCQENIGYAAF